MLVPLFLACSAISACGGGGSGGDTAPAQTPTAAAPAAPIAPASRAPAPVPVLRAGCTPEVVALRWYGDSTQMSVTPNNVLSPNSPWIVVRDALLARFGAGSVTSESRGVGHMTSNSLVLGTDGLNAPWPIGVTPGALTLVNYGINDSAELPLELYKANLRALNPAYFETPNPTDSPLRPHERTQAYAQAMRDVAAELGTPLIDVNAYVMSLPNWGAYLADGIHPSDELYALIARNAVLPVLLPAVAKLRCE